MIGSETPVFTGNYTQVARFYLQFKSARLRRLFIKNLFNPMALAALLLTGSHPQYQRGNARHVP